LEIDRNRSASPNSDEIAKILIKSCQKWGISSRGKPKFCNSRSTKSGFNGFENFIEIINFSESTQINDAILMLICWYLKPDIEEK
jgi:hypothetical protein